MKIVIVNGSPRKGNTSAAIEAFSKGVNVNHEIEVIEACKLNITPCEGCGACQGKNKCIITDDDTNATIDKLVAADMIVFASPVYWCGITSQLKLVIDKCYSQVEYLKGKIIGIITIGAASVFDEQYRLIESQYRCIAKSLGWDIKFSEKFKAYGTTDLANNTRALLKLEKIWEYDVLKKEKMIPLTIEKIIEEYEATGKLNSLPDKEGAFRILLPEGFEVKFKSTSDAYKCDIEPYTAEYLEEKWSRINKPGLEDNNLIYVGNEKNLRIGIQHFIKFGTGKTGKHVSGRAIWQIEDNRKLLLEYTEATNPLWQSEIRKFRYEHTDYPLANFKAN